MESMISWNFPRDRWFRSATLPAMTDRSGEVVARIKAAMSGLVPSEVKVAELILAEPETVLGSSVSSVADRAGTAESTVIRACQRIGYKGFHDVKLALARDLATGAGQLERSRDLTPDTPLG